jgi:hypothetical protein
MRNFFLATLFSLAAFSQSASAISLLEYNFDGLLSPSGGSLQANGTAVSGSGLTTVNLLSNNLQINNTPDTAFNALNYASFALTANPGYLFNPSTITFFSQRTSAGREGFLQLRTSLDGFASSVFLEHIFDNTLADLDTATLTGSPVSALEVRLYAYAAPSCSSTGSIQPCDAVPNIQTRLRIENLKVEGTQVAAQSPSIPEPTTFALLGLGLVGFTFGTWRQRNHHQWG